MVKVITQFKYNCLINNSTIFNQPLFYLGSLLKKTLLKTEVSHSYFNKITIINEMSNGMSKDIYLEIEAYNKHNNNKINYLLDRLKYDDEINFIYDNAKLTFKTEKICDKNAITIHRDEFALFSTFSIMCDEEDFEKFEDFIDTCIKYYNKFYDECQLGKDEIKLMLSSDEGGYFTSLGYRKKRSLDTIYLPAKQKQKMIDDLTYFLDEKTKAKYAKLGILHKRTYLFEGIPGSGKSSFIMALASHFGYNLAIISFTPKMHDNDLIRLLRSLEEKEENKVFIIFEDMDCIFKERKSNDESRNMITFSGILNALDGITTRDNMICFITTNYKQHLDSALIRPGRVDSIFRFDYVNKEQVIDIFTAFTERPDKAQLFYDELSRFNINVSASLLQQYLLKYIDEPNIDKAIDNIDELKKMYDAAHVSKEAGETGLYN